VGAECGRSSRSQSGERGRWILWVIPQSGRAHPNPFGFPTARKAFLSGLRPAPGTLNVLCFLEIPSHYHCHEIPMSVEWATCSKAYSIAIALRIHAVYPHGFGHCPQVRASRECPASTPTFRARRPSSLRQAAPRYYLSTLPRVPIPPAVTCCRMRNANLLPLILPIAAPASGPRCGKSQCNSALPHSTHAPRGAGKRDRADRGSALPAFEGHDPLELSFRERTAVDASGRGGVRKCALGSRPIRGRIDDFPRRVTRQLCVLSRSLVRPAMGIHSDHRRGESGPPPHTCSPAR
jgi:hypothetical protein